MKTMSYTESRAKYAEVLDAVVSDREEIVITRAGHEPVVIVSLENFESLRETAYLMRSPANARRLLDAMERLLAGDEEGCRGRERLGGLPVVAGPGPQSSQTDQPIDPGRDPQRQ